MPDNSFRVESGANRDGLRITIHDNASHEVVAYMQLDNDETLSLLRGGSFQVDGRITARLDRVGKIMMNDQVEVPRSVLNDFGYNDRDAKLQAAEQWARENTKDWEQFEPRHTNTGGVKVVMRKWVEA
jgi:hypothetical protein